MVNVVWSADGHTAICGGVLISPTRVLTANHCVHSTGTAPNGDVVTVSPDTPSNFHVYVNRYNYFSDEGRVHEVSQIIEHPAYVEPYESDIAILILATPSSARTADLLTPAQMAEIGVGASVDLVGWGNPNDSPTPLATTLELTGVGTECINKQFTYVTTDGSVHTATNLAGRSTTVCIGKYAYPAGGYSSTENGDSGGPAYVWRDGKWIVLGVTSFGPSFVGWNFYSSVPHFYDWIVQNAPDLGAIARGFMIRSDANPALAVHASGGADEGRVLELTSGCEATNPECTFSYEDGMLRSDADPTLAVNAWGGAGFGTSLVLTRACSSANSDCTWTYRQGEFLSDTNQALKINAFGGAAEGTLLRLHDGCSPTNPDCTFTLRGVLLTSNTDPTMAINAWGGAGFGTELRLHNGCSTANPDCTWTFIGGRILSDTDQSLAMNAFGGAAEGTSVRLHNGCSTANTDCTWTWSHGVLFSDTNSTLAMGPLGGTGFGAYLRLTSECGSDPDCLFSGLLAGR
jgi:hypothetical protein